MFPLGDSAVVQYVGTNMSDAAKSMGTISNFQFWNSSYPHTYVNEWNVDDDDDDKIYD